MDVDVALVLGIQLLEEILDFVYLLLVEVDLLFLPVLHEPVTRVGLWLEDVLGIIRDRMEGLLLQLPFAQLLVHFTQTSEVRFPRERLRNVVVQSRFASVVDPRIQLDLVSLPIIQICLC